jgi:putative transposase
MRELSDVAIINRGFASQDLINYCCQSSRYFFVRINRNHHLYLDEKLGYLRCVNSSIDSQCRIINFCDLEKRTEYRIATNLPPEGENSLTNLEISEIYRRRWEIELLWKFLKMHLKLDKLITKNPNSILIQIYTCLIGYLILKLVNIPEEFGRKLPDNLRYLQANMNQFISYVHWLDRILLS